MLCNKGDNVKPDMRARLVACEVNKGGDRQDCFFASTPPLEAKKLLFSRFAQERKRKGKPLRLDFLDENKCGLLDISHPSTDPLAECQRSLHELLMAPLDQN